LIDITFAAIVGIGACRAGRFMRFLDLDLDFFLSANTYGTECDRGSSMSRNKPWSIFKVRQFLEERCGLSPETRVYGRTVKQHNGVFDFWRTLIKSGSLRIPFEVVHIDAHPDLCIRGGLHLRSEALYFDPELVAPMLKVKQIHPGNYLTFALASGWISALVWVPLILSFKGPSKWDGDARSNLKHLKKSPRKSSDYVPPVSEDSGIPFEIVPWRKFRSAEKFDYIAVSRSPDFTPPESDKLIAVIEEYMTKI
jgi:hypothetical protein